MNKHIEHTLLKVNSLQTQIEQLIIQAQLHQFYGVCIAPYYVSFAKNLLKTDQIKIISVAGFSMGYEHYLVKCEAIKHLAKDGLDEIDVVTNIAAIKNKQWRYVAEEWEAIIKTAKNKELPIKIIIESGLMDEAELAQLCNLANTLQPNFIKTSTGFNGTGAELDKVAFLRKHLKPTIKIKASGGIKFTTGQSIH